MQQNAFEKFSSGINDPKELFFFLSGNFDFQAKLWTSGWLPIPKHLWLKSNASDNDFPILGTCDYFYILNRLLDVAYRQHFLRPCCHLHNCSKR